MASSRNEAAEKKRPWTVSCICSSNKFSCRVPSATEKDILQSAGLGFKKIKLDLFDSEEAVFRKLTSDQKVDIEDENAPTVGYPALKTCGGFELLSCIANFTLFFVPIIK